MKITLKMLLVIAFCACCFSEQDLWAPIIVEKIVDTKATTFPCPMTIGWFEGTGSIFLSTVIFTAHADLKTCTLANVISQGTFISDGSTMEQLTISGTNNSLTATSATAVIINPVILQLERKYMTLTGVTTFTALTVNTYVTLTVVGSSVTIGGVSVPAGTYELSPGQPFPW